MKTLTCFIRYQIDPFQRDAGTNDVAWGLIAFASLAGYEAYHARLRADPEGQANFAFARQKRLILREERTFCENVEPA